MSDAEIPPWTVKGIPQEARDRMNSAARRADMRLGPWLIMAADQAIERERSGFGIAPQRVLQGPPGPPEGFTTLEEAERLGALLERLTEASHGKRAVTLARKALAQRLQCLLLPVTVSAPPRIPRQ